MSGEDPAGENAGASAYRRAAARAAALAAIMRQPAAVADAELAAQGLYPVSIAHGSAADDAESELIHRILPDLAQSFGSLTSTRGGSEHTTFVFAGERADEHAAEFEARAGILAPRWWRITRGATPRWR